ncbi:oxidoreductase [Aliidongia dinghuensis]|uniref:Oxidoreductase n=1 Tax=Aliidongia dinghuensis TaxID=1867774 RepID=A0A8J2YVD5_9PROT|nr:aldo/keto reductase [Aliidongia dinghuensis]GGF23931.1 oxidoreductase [Aliidongia dinghuensis]
MRYRSLGSSGLSVSEIGFGAWGIGGTTPGSTSYGETEDAASLEALERAFELGVNFFDTADVYGYGHSERLIGTFIRGRRDRVIIASKVGMTRYDQPADFSERHLEASLDASLARLGTDRLDLLQLHSPPPSLLEKWPAAIKVLGGFLDDGRVRALGISLASPRDLWAFDELDAISVIQVNLNMLDRRAVTDGVLARAAERRLGVIARTPLCSGFLSGAVNRQTRFGPGDHRNRWSPQQVGRWIDGADDAFGCMMPGTEGTRAQIALRYCLSYPEVSTVIPGMLGAADVQENVRASDFGPLPAEDRSRIEMLENLLVERPPERLAP